MESMRDEIRQFVVASEHLLRNGVTAGELSRRAHWAGVSMECTAIDPSSRHEYKGRTISLFVSQADNGTWRCRNVFIQFSPIKSACVSSYPAGSFATQQEAKAAALQKAKRLIDAEDPLSS